MAQVRKSDIVPPRTTALSTDMRTIYAVGDIHGRADLLDQLVEKISADSDGCASDALKPKLVFLGDYIDRGPESRRVVETIIGLGSSTRFEVVALKGNHEQALLDFLREPSLGPPWMNHGGSATLSSYGVATPTLRTDAQAWAAAREALLEAIPQPHLEFYNALGLMAVIGDYAFVHAGVRPGVPLSRQPERDLLWIRDDFLASTHEFEKVIVHGHTPEEIPSIGRLRIGIDTGAYATGVLTAVRLYGRERRFLQTGASGRATADSEWA